MTGFGLGDAPLGSGRLVVELRAVNARMLDIRVRMPRELLDFVPYVDADARKRLSRGRIDVSVRTEGAVFAAPAIDRTRASGAYRSLLELRDELAPGADVPLSMLASLPDLFVPPVEREFDAIRATLARALGAALDALETMREEEGSALALDLEMRLMEIRKLGCALRERAPQVLDAYLDKLRERLARAVDRATAAHEPAGLARRSPLPIDPLRMEQELVLFADRSDICEELTRLESHVAQFERYVRSTEPTGRRLDFLLQEMAREINTVGAKSQDASMAHLVVEAKAELERMREQVQNVE